MSQPCRASVHFLSRAEFFAMKSIRLTLGLLILLGCAVLPMRAANGITYQSDTIAPSYLKSIFGVFYCSVNNSGTTEWTNNHRLRLFDDQGTLVASPQLAYGALPVGGGTSIG